MTSAVRRSTAWGASGTSEALARALARLLLPGSCAACGGDADGALCAACLATCRPPPGPRCPRCGEGGVAPAARCPRCARFGRTFAFARASAMWRYEGRVRLLVHAFKYRGARGVLGGLGRRMARTPTLLPGRGARVVTCVPLRPFTRWRRGYNQAEDLAQGFARERGWPFARDALARRRGGPSQVGAALGRRRRQARAAFRARPELVDGRRVVLVDDVLSTGATADACTRALLVAGASRVDVVTLAG